MTKKTIAGLLALILALTAPAGCGRVVPLTESGAAPTEMGNAPTEVEDRPTEAENSPTEAGNSPTEAGNSPTEGENAPTGETEPTPAAPREETAFRPGAHLERVENNGGLFVSVDGSVYFRRYGAGTLLPTAYFGDFLSNPNLDAREESAILRRDPAGVTEELFTAVGWGPLYYGNGGFYLQEPGEGAPLVCWRSPDGSERREIGPGVILGVSGSGDLLAAQTYSWETGVTVTLYRNGEESGRLRPGNRGFVFAGLTDAGLFFLEQDYDTPELSLCQLQADGSTEAITLGKLSLPDYGASVEVDDFVTAGGKVGVLVGFYAGTGRFLNDLVAVQARVGASRSLSLLYESYGNEPPDYVPRLTADDAGVISLAERLPGEVWVNDRGDLCRWNDGEELLLAGAERLREEGRGFCRFVQSAESVGGDVWLLTAGCHAWPPNSVGWRDAYRLVDLAVLRVGPGGETEELAFTDCGAVFRGSAWLLLPPEEERETGEGEGEEPGEGEGEEPGEGEGEEPGEGEGEEPGESVSLPVPTALLWKPAEEGELELRSAFLLDLAPDMRLVSAYDDLSQAAEEAGVRLAGTPEYDGWPLPDTPGLSVRFTLDREGRIGMLEILG